MRARLGLVVLLSACSPEAISALAPTGLEGPLTELSHEVTVQTQGPTARLVVRRAVRSEADGWQSSTLPVLLPEGAVATSVRVRAQGRWMPAPRLGTAESIDERWEALRTFGDAPPLTVARLRWDDSNTLALDLFGVPPRGELELEYEVEVPRDYAQGALRFDYPRSELTPVFQLSQAGGTVLEPLDETEFELREAWSPRDDLELRWATLPVGVDRHLFRLELDVAARLSELPRRPNVLLLIDASHSQGPEGIAGQLAIIAPLLANVPDAQVEVIVYRRFAERLFGRFVDAPEVPAMLAQLPAERLAPGNGSNVEAAMELAANLLAREPGAGRVLLFTDDQLSSTVTADRVQRRFPPEVALHVLNRSRFQYGSLQLSRDDTLTLAPLAERQGGQSAALSGTMESGELAQRLLLGLLRPTRIDDVVVHAAGTPEEPLEVEAVLDEGAAVRVDDVKHAVPTAFVLEGRAWSRRVRVQVGADPRLGERLPALAVGIEKLRDALEDDELRSVAFAANAVSPVTSFLSMPDDAAPSWAGRLPTEEEGHGCFGGLGVSSSCSTRCGIGVVGVWDVEKQLKALLSEGVAACRARHGSLPTSLVLEATQDEVVRVEARAASADLARCVEEAAWAVRLTPAFDRHGTWELQL